MTSLAYDALELYCYGLPLAAIGSQLGRKPDALPQAILRAARAVGRQGFWKFHVQSMDDAYIRRRDLLDRLHFHGLVRAA